VFDSWESNRAVRYRSERGIPNDLGTAVTVQAMVFGNRDEHSGTGVSCAIGLAILDAESRFILHRVALRECLEIK
jgi:hypothetical protein